jgi:hypothetical protein
MILKTLGKTKPRHKYYFQNLKQVINKSENNKYRQGHGEMVNHVLLVGI